ncbi:MAG: DUF4920 domain-containing protein [Ignavibacterium sp.]|nr:DUF4920 domain-containing protein [Ignavibacterium sp.]MDW8375757.1 DUF4920 domain-containing protein [Ignavibacteriales bacterium]
MKNLLLPFVLIYSFLTFAQVAHFGKEIKLTEFTEISDILENPEEFVDERVLISGKVVDVCSKSGCWMELQDDNGNEIIVKVKDGEIVFPESIVGSTAVVEGLVYKISLSKEEAIEFFEHLAEEEGEEFDPSTVTGPVTIYQIKGIGVEVDLDEE